MRVTAARVWETAVLLQTAMMRIHTAATMLVGRPPYQEVSLAASYPARMSSARFSAASVDIIPGRRYLSTVLNVEIPVQYPRPATLCPDNGIKFTRGGFKLPDGEDERSSA